MKKRLFPDLSVKDSLCVSTEDKLFWNDEKLNEIIFLKLLYI